MKNYYGCKLIGGCMRPLLKNKGFVLIEPVKLQQLKIGDMVLYKNFDETYIHRLWKINKNKTVCIIGDDACIINKHEISSKNIAGRVVSIFNGNLGYIYGRSFNILFYIFRKIKNIFTLN